MQRMNTLEQESLENRPARSARWAEDYEEPSRLDDLRAVVFRVLFTAITFAYGVLGVFVLPFGRRAIQGFCALWARSVLVLLRYVCGIRARVRNPERLPTGPALVAANHQSMWETLFLCARLPNPYFVVKAELLRIPIFGFWLKRAGMIAIDRNQGPRALKRLITAARERLSDNGQIVIFPEGTRMPVGETTRFKPGIAGAYSGTNVPCIPIGHDSGRYWFHPGWQKRRGTVDIRVGTVLPAGMDRRAFLHALEQAIAALRPDLKAEPLQPISSEKPENGAP